MGEADASGFMTEVRLVLAILTERKHMLTCPMY
jgi:hypothetical protein